MLLASTYIIVLSVVTPIGCASAKSCMLQIKFAAKMSSADLLWSVILVALFARGEGTAYISQYCAIPYTTAKSIDAV